jgi:hypothetical protein
MAPLRLLHPDHLNYIVICLQLDCLHGLPHFQLLQSISGGHDESRIRNEDVAFDNRRLVRFCDVG